MIGLSAIDLIFIFLRLLAITDGNWFSKTAMLSIQDIHQESKRNKVSVLEQPSADLNPREMQKNEASRSFEETLLNPRVKAFKFLQAQVQDCPAVTMNASFSCACTRMSHQMLKADVHIPLALGDMDNFDMVMWKCQTIFSNE